MPHYIATVKDDRTLELPQEAWPHVQPGQIVEVELPDSSALTIPQPNYAMLAALDEIVKRQEGRRHTDGSKTDEIIREGRAGAMYGDPPT